MIYERMFERIYEAIPVENSEWMPRWISEGFSKQIRWKFLKVIAGEVSDGAH